ncbi:MAG: hypothetical protein ACRC0L_02300, partial [Angustibacter sp.]
MALADMRFSLAKKANFLAEEVQDVERGPRGRLLEPSLRVVTALSTELWRVRGSYRQLAQEITRAAEFLREAVLDPTRVPEAASAYGRVVDAAEMVLGQQQARLFDAESTPYAEPVSPQIDARGDWHLRKLVELAVKAERNQLPLEFDTSLLRLRANTYSAQILLKAHDLASIEQVHRVALVQRDYLAAVARSVALPAQSAPEERAGLPLSATNLPAGVTQPGPVGESRDRGASGPATRSTGWITRLGQRLSGAGPAAPAAATPITAARDAAAHDSAAPDSAAHGYPADDAAELGWARPLDDDPGFGEAESPRDGAGAELGEDGSLPDALAGPAANRSGSADTFDLLDAESNTFFPELPRGVWEVIPEETSQDLLDSGSVE